MDVKPTGLLFFGLVRKINGKAGSMRQASFILFFIAQFILASYMPSPAASNDSIRIARHIETFQNELYSDTAIAHQSIDSAVLLAIKFNEPRLLLKALNGRSQLYLMRNKQKEAKKDIDRALELQNNRRDWVDFSSTYSNLGLYFFNRAEFESSVEAHISAAKIAEQNDYVLGLARSYNNIGNVYIKLKDYLMAREYYNKAYAIAEEENMKGGMAHVLGNLGIVYTNLGKLDSAIYSIRKSLAIHRAQNNLMQVAYNYSNLGQLFRRLDRTDSARFYYNQYLELSKQQQNDQNVLSAVISLMEIEMQSGNIDRVAQYLSDYDNLFRQNGSMELKSKYYQLKSEVLEHQNDWEMALQARKLHEQWQDSTEGKDLRAEVEALNIRYQTEQKEKELLEQKALLAQRENIIIMISLIAVFALILTALVFMLYRQKRENRYQKESIAAITAAQEKERQRVARDLHDSVGVMLANLKNQLSVHKHLKEEMDVLNSISGEVRQISHDMMPGTLKKFGLEAAIRSELDITSKSTGLQTTFNEIGLNGHLDEEMEVHLYRIVQEAVQNVVKHAGASTLNLSLTRDFDSLNVMIEDDGKGFDTSGMKSQGLGLKNIRTRVALLNGKLSIDSHPSAGTSMIIEIPL
jgi:two-component system NarL family sensor kinase